METKKVRIALEINSDGEWQAVGNNVNVECGDDWDMTMDAMEPLEGHHVKRHWIEAEVPVPAAEAEVVAGSAVEAPAKEEVAA